MQIYIIFTVISIILIFIKESDYTYVLSSSSISILAFDRRKCTYDALSSKEIDTWNIFESSKMLLSATCPAGWQITSSPGCKVTLIVATSPTMQRNQGENYNNI